MLTHLHTLCGYRCLWVHICEYMERSEIESGIVLNCSSNLFTETGSLSQTQTVLPSEAGIIGRPPLTKHLHGFSSPHACKATT